MPTVVEHTAKSCTMHRGSAPPGLKVNLGCGPVINNNWVNVDGSRRSWLATHAWPLDRLLVGLRLIPPTAFNPSVTYHNLCRPLPWRTGSIAAIYAGEVWEHLEYEDAKRLTQECHRVLKTGGVLRLCVPDGVEFWERYLAIFAEQKSRDRPARDVARLRQHVQMYFDDICTKPPRLQSFGHFHKWQYDEVQLIDLFERCQFQEVARERFGVSRISDIAALERSDFLIVEGVKG
ncbi:MAG: class I SAM-dependent methyltransferase [Acidiferrobacter sp.]